MTTNYNSMLLGKVLAAKYINSLAGKVEQNKLGRFIKHTVLPSGVIIKYKWHEQTS